MGRKLATLKDKLATFMAKLATHKAKLPYILSVFFLTVTLIKLILLCVFYDKAVHGMAKRLKIIVDINPHETSWGIIIFSVLFGLWLVFLCLADIIAMAGIDGVDLSRFGFVSKIACIGSYCSVTVLAILIRLQTIVWAIVLSIIGVLCSLAVILIKATDALCSSIENNSTTISPINASSSETALFSSNCIDLTVLKPAVQIFTTKPARLSFCESDRTAFCSHSDADDDDMFTTFFHCYMVGVLVLIGLLHFLINMVGNKNRYHQLRFMRRTVYPNDVVNMKAME
uniref:Uncharacterized protein n=1 Tax=Plectus sambesii TaxID=2011161 RepID=A0A914WVC8_9BILA